VADGKKGNIVRRILLCLTVAAFARAAVTVQSPAEYQAFQRVSSRQGTIAVRAQADSCDAAEVRVESGPWRKLGIEGGCRLAGEVTAPAGGWYTIEVRVSGNGRPAGSARVGHVGVGEVFVISGQSNATNYGEALQQPKSGMVSAFNGSEWQPANDPQPGVQDRSAKGSFIPAFGDALYAKYRVPIGVACVGFGGTSVRQWLPEGDRFRLVPTAVRFVRQVGENDWESDGRLFAGMMERIGQLGRRGFRALLWHQGESDANQAEGHELSGADYRRMMERVIRESRRQAGRDFPWIVAQATYHSPSVTSSPEIREAQAALWKDRLALEGPDTDRFGEPYRQNGGRGIHFSALGLEAHGKAWAEKVRKYLDGVL
jgi:hypothetical protein